MRLLPLICCCLFIGCSSIDGTDSLEAKLRNQDDRIVQLEGKLSDEKREKEILTAEARVLRSRLKDPAAAPRTEQFAAGLAVDDLEISGLLTGMTEDGTLHVVIRPIDADGDLIKLPGRLEVRLLDMSSAKGEEEFKSWTWGADEARKLWSSAAIGAGYVVDLPIDNTPDADEFIVHARFLPQDGRQFDATHTVSTR